MVTDFFSCGENFQDSTQQLSNLQYRIVNSSHHAVYYIPRGLTAKFEPFSLLYSIHPPSIPPSGNCQYYSGFLEKFVDGTCYLPNGLSGYLITGCSSK